MKGGQRLGGVTPGSQQDATRHPWHPHPPTGRECSTPGPLKEEYHDEEDEEEKGKEKEEYNQ